MFIAFLTPVLNPLQCSYQSCKTRGDSQDYQLVSSSLGKHNQAKTCPKRHLGLKNTGLIIGKCNGSVLVILREKF